MSGNVPIIACVLKSGGDFRAEHVKRLADNLQEVVSVPYQFVCLTDVDFSHSKIITLPLVHNWPGWWSKIELFKLVGFVITFDLDTMFFGSIDNFIKAVAGQCHFYLLKSFLPPERGLSGVMGWNGDYRCLYDEFDYEIDSRRFRGDQNYIRSKLQEWGFPTAFVQDSLNGVYSWKRHCNGIVPEDCNMLIFHGKPRPWQVPEVWQTKEKEAV